MADGPPARAVHDPVLERAYSPSSCIGGNYQPFLQAYAARSAAAHEQALAAGAGWCEWRYGDDPAQRLDLYLPPQRSTPAACALLVFIHGGYWQELSARDSRFAAAACTAAGHAFCALDYRLAPAVRLPQIVADVRAALTLLRQRTAVLGVDVRRMVLAGHSAGAHLAMMAAGPTSGSAAAAAAASTWHPPPPSRAWPAAVVGVSGVYELQPLLATSINDALALDAAGAAAMSPLRLSTPRLPRALIGWGAIETDAFKAQSRAMARHLGTGGTPVTTMEIAARNHFDVILDLAEPGTPLGDAVGRLLCAEPQEKTT